MTSSCPNGRHFACSPSCTLARRACSSVSHRGDHHDNPQRGEGLIGFTFSLDPQGSAGLSVKVVVHRARAKPAPHHSRTYGIESPPPSPPGPHPISTLPPRPPPMASPPRALSPPPMQHVVASAAPAARRLCKDRTYGFRQQAVARVVVTMDSWEAGYVVTLGFDGEGMLVAHATSHVANQPRATADDAMRSFSFTLGEEPIETSAFAVIEA